MKKLLLAFIALFTAVAAPAAPGVVSSADPRVSAAGREILRAGGSAADAAMAMMLALTVVEPQSSGIGGGGFLVYHDGRSSKIATIDGRETAPLAARPERFVGADGKPLPFIQAFPGGLSVGVPGNIALMARTHARWGKLPWARLFEPAIRLAGGYQVSRTMAGYLTTVAPLWKDFPETQALFWENGAPKPAGATVTNPQLVQLLRDVAAGGPKAFYEGPTAAAIVAAARGAKRNPSDLTLDDLTAYRAKDRDALCAPYRQYRVCGMGPPSSGATTILQMLGMLERFDLPKLGPDSPQAWFLIGQAMQLAYADREKYLGDADFVSVPVAGLLDRRYLADRSALITPGKALTSYSAGSPPGAAPRTAAVSSEVAGTTHFVAVDRAGNVATMTSTVEGLFGSQLVARGMILNNELTDFTFAPLRDGAPVANAVAGGKRPLSSMSPTIVYDTRGRVVFAVGSAGGKRIIMHVMKALVGKLDWGLSGAQALALPNLYFGGTGLLIENTAAGTRLQPAIAAFGQPVIATELTSKLNAVERTRRGWLGSADPRSEGVALSE